MQSVLDSSEAELLLLFDLGSPDLTVERLLTHLRARQIPAIPPYPQQFTDAASCPTPELIDRADRILAHRFQLVDEPEVHFEGAIDWQYDPTSDPRRRWARELNRHRWVPDLAEAFARTGDERYAAKCVALLVDWIRKNPPPATMNESHVSWTLMGVGLRCVVWIPSFFTLLRSGSFDSNSQLLILASFHDHARFLNLFKTRDNHLLREINGLAAVASAFPEFCEAAQWKRTALARLGEELEKQINTDGSHIEMSSGYQWMVAEELDAVYDTLERSAWTVPGDALKRALQAIYTVLAGMARPNGTWPLLGDGFMYSTASLRDQLQQASVRLNRPDLRFVATNGASGEVPSSRSVHFPDAGLSIMRSDHGAAASYLLMKAGPFGGVHGHEDKLAIEAGAYGEVFLVDPGTYTYNATDPYRAYFVSSNAHSTVLVDGKSQIRRWLPECREARAGIREPADWITTDTLDFASGRYEDGYGDYAFNVPKRMNVLGATHCRSVLFVKPSYWLIIDRMTCAGEHAFTRVFQAAPGLTAHEAANGVTLEGSAATLHIRTADASEVALAVESGASEPIRGWVSNGHRNHKVPAPQVSMTSRAVDEATLVTLMFPASNAEVMAEVAVEHRALDAGIGTLVRVTARHARGAAFEDWLMLSDNGNEKRFCDWQTTARIAGLRRHEDGQVSVLFELQ